MHNNLFTCGSDAGKKTVLDPLQQNRMKVIEESGCKIIITKVKLDGYVVPWKDNQKYAELMAEDSIETHISVNSNSEITLFDRDIPDTPPHRGG